MFVPMTRMVHIPRIISAPRDPGAIVGKAFALVLPGVIGGLQPLWTNHAQNGSK